PPAARAPATREAGRRGSGVHLSPRVPGSYLLTPPAVILAGLRPRRLDRMEPWPSGRRRPIVGGEWSAPTHLSWVAGVRPVEPHTEVADHGRVYDGNCRVGRAREVDPACGDSGRRAARGADVAL